MQKFIIKSPFHWCIYCVYFSLCKLKCFNTLHALYFLKYNIPNTCNKVYLSTDVDECLQFPCQHGGQCRNLNGTYFCDCPAGWMGPRCQFGRFWFLKMKILIEIFRKINMKHDNFRRGKEIRYPVDGYSSKLKMKGVLNSFRRKRVCTTAVF